MTQTDVGGDSSGLDTTLNICRICKSGDVRPFQAREMMFGMRERFQYLECMFCGCLQIEDYPNDISRFYPPDYYSFQDRDVFQFPDGSLEKLKFFFKNQTFKFFPSLWQKWLTQSWVQRNFLSGDIEKLYLKYLNKNSVTILDVGCGVGHTVKKLTNLHFYNVLGVDPFIAKDIYYRGKLLVARCSLSNLRRKFQCVTMHHVLEHLPHQFDVMRQVHNVLADDGMVIIRIPIAGTHAWEKYRENWVQLDPPRHFYLHSERSFRLLAEQTGFSVSEIYYDSQGFQFLGSEAYLRDVCLQDFANSPIGFREIFTADQITAFDAEAVALNQNRDGDQIVAILRKA